MFVRIILPPVESLKITDHGLQTAAGDRPPPSGPAVDIANCIGYLDRAGLYQINNHLEPSLGIKRAVSLSEAMLLYSIVFVLFCKNVLLVKVTWNLN